MRKSYIYRRNNHAIDMLLSNHHWMQVVISDGATGGGDYEVRIFRTRFVVADPTPGADSSAAIATALIAEINGGAEAVEAFAGANANEVLIRFSMLGQAPNADNAVATTTDEEGSITIRSLKPSSYLVRSAPNWDGVFADMQEVSTTRGHVSETLRKYQDAHPINASEVRHRTRFLFDPSDYDLEDTDVGFYQVHTNVGGTTIEEDLIEIVMTASQSSDVGEDALILSGTVPDATLEDALWLEFQVRSSSFEIRNIGATNDLLFSFGSGPSEIRLEPGQSYSDARVNIVGFTLRGDGGPTDVEIYTTILTSKFMA